jgi:predicted anti-sigma-YlaC factor YlaD
LKCKSVIRELSNYLDGDLDGVLKLDLERHLQHCEDCSMVVDQTKRTVEIFCGSEPLDLPTDVRSRLHQALHKKMVQRPN